MQRWESVSHTNPSRGVMDRMYRILLRSILMVNCATGSAVLAQDAQPTAVLFENVHIFNGKASTLSAPSNVLVRGNKIEKISTEALDVDRRADIHVGHGT